MRDASSPSAEGVKVGAALSAGGVWGGVSGAPGVITFLARFERER